ncbi:hypothetical protein NG42_01880 [Winslowiella iniecta]|uniref:Major facilitator superfamily (MFS) profile domain-containing protein n=1 Tax=Winslowiella iniecta TaxID=1560201 RepID=A0A0L7TB74_9GAMM|nr:hypothetical protein NG43_18625 [Winslowiella iniecta]KOC92613.1 hypothetical protein NG42_01880 [Winslowiella iniecta]
MAQPSAGNAALPWKNWLAVGVLGISSFSIVTTELAPVGLLSPLADDFGLTTGKAGLIVTAYAWIAAIAALLSATLLSRVPRKPLLIGLMTLLALSSFVAAGAAQFSTLLIARMAGALAHGAFWAMIGTVGAQLVPANRIGLATSIIFGGVSAASVAGVPLANLLAQSDGWRTAFIAVSALSLIAAGAMLLTLPRLPRSVSPGWRELSAIVRNRSFLLIYATTACAITAHFAAFTYIEPLLSKALHIRPGLVSSLLLVFGVAGILGNVISGKLIDRQLKPLVLVALMLMAAAVLAIGLLPDNGSALSASALLLGWGIGVAIVFVGFQSWILRLAGEAAMPASAIYVAIFNAAIGAGALVGGAILSVSSLSGLMMIVSAALIVSLLAVIVIKAPQQ